MVREFLLGGYRLWKLVMYPASWLPMSIPWAGHKRLWAIGGMSSSGDDKMSSEIVAEREF
jgi:hypothetical protein